MDPSQSLNNADHDLIISLNVKVDRLITDMRDNHADNTSRISKIESRLDTIDIYHGSIDLPHFKNNSEWIDDLRANFKLIIAVGGMIFAIIEAFLTSLIRHYFGI